MAKGRREDEWFRWAKWMSIYAEAHRNKEKKHESYTPNDFLPSEFKIPLPPKPPVAKVSVRQLAGLMGMKIEVQNGSGSQ